MPETLRNLTENLNRQALLYKELNHLAELKQKALMENKLHDLEAITVHEEKLLLDASRLEKERLLWAEKIGQEMGKAPEELTLKELAEHYPELQGVREELDHVVMSLQETHKVNTQLLQQAMKIVDFTVSLLTQKEETTYNHPGRKKNESGKQLRFLDTSV